MEEILLLLATSPAEAFKKLKEQGKKPEDITNIRKEYIDLDRNIRNSQVGKIQEDKTIDGKIVEAVKLPIDYAGKIVDTAVAFEVGEPVTLIPQFDAKKESDLAKLIKQLWKSNRVDNLIQKALTQKKSETQAAFLLYITDIKEGSTIQKILNFIGLAKQKKEIKISILENKNGIMYPYFDAFGDMKAFTWDFTTKDASGQDIKNTWVYTETDIFKSVNEAIPTKEPHGFDKIPVIYTAQDKPEYAKAQPLIDRQEVSLSKLCDSNDRTAHPLLKIFGEVQSFPGKNDNGKVLNFPITIDEVTQKEVHGDAEFLTNDNAPESAKLELETIENLISYVTSTPILSLNQLKGIGNVAEKTVKLMFLDPIIKAKKNEGDNRTMIERIINVMVSGIVKTTNTNFKSEAEKLYFDIQFNSILPGDLLESSEVVTSLKEAGLISTKTAVEYMGMNENVDEELEMISLEKSAEPKKPEPEPVN